MALASGTSRPLIGRLPGTARPHLAVSSSSASSIRFPGGRAVSLRASAPPAATPGRSPKSLLVLLSFAGGSAAATTAMLSAAASAIPRIRWAVPPRHSSSRTQWLLQRRRTLSSSSSNVTPAAAAGSGAGALEPPDLPRLADAARISLSPQEAEEFAPKIRQMVDWFGQLQAVDLKSIEPSLRAGTVAGSSLREDKPEAFANRDAIVEAVPSYDDPYIKVPRVLNKE